MNYIPNIISASRGFAALVMLLSPAFSPGFWVLYCWCGFSDMIDGMIARKMNAESKIGSKIDSGADLIFVVCTAVLILPSVDLPVWVWAWIIVIGSVKIVGILASLCRLRELSIPHSITNRLTGILLFCLPIAIVWSDVLIPVVIVCISATVSIFEDFHIILK